MQLEFHNSFSKDIDKIKALCLALIDKIRTIEKISEIPKLKKLEGSKNFYRIRIGDYRIGIEYKDQKILFKRFLSRKDIYKYFP